MNNTNPKKPKNYYEFTEAALVGHKLYGKLGCNNCHRALGTGEVGFAPVLEGEGTKRSRDWLARYFDDPGSLVPGTAHDGSLGPDFRDYAAEDKVLLTEFLFALKANPGSPSYPRPPIEALARE